MGFRIHIDIPLSITDEEEAILHGLKIMETIRYSLGSQPFGKLQIDQVNFRLGHDEDRQKSNYFDKNQNGHVSNKKSKILLGIPLTDNVEKVD